MIKSVFQLFLLFQINTGMYQNTFGTETERSLQFKRKGLHIPEVYSPKPAGQTNSVATYNLYHFMRQHTAYYGRRHSYYAFFCQWRRRKKFPVAARSIRMVEHGDLSFKTTDCTIYIRPMQAGCDIIENITRGKVVATIHHYIIIL